MLCHGLLNARVIWIEGTDTNGDFLAPANLLQRSVRTCYRLICLYSNLVVEWGNECRLLNPKKFGSIGSIRFLRFPGIIFQISLPVGVYNFSDFPNFPH